MEVSLLSADASNVALLEKIKELEARLESKVKRDEPMPETKREGRWKRFIAVPHNSVKIV